ncbi:sulfur carrier protein ThiS [Pseudoruegeria sp. SK021]|uniref:sulfur carrier protein ThiS n=1 Tax=Pseudoruegeria sp. SK021 TaxID=1933035 RepID=UPI000A253782|nr:sulfur carrier protein ThiS [Pseudoruegeria sp. SK021]OSP53562.1 thiamine biosynthesis protein ThiS [Pseudoruegeria sp. SK021]
MRLQLNGEPVDTEAATLQALLLERDYGDAVVATAVNGRFVPGPARADLKLNPGDLIEVLAPMQGG